MIDQRHLRTTPLFDAVGSSSVPMSRALKSQTISGSEQETAINVKDNPGVANTDLQHERHPFATRAHESTRLLAVGREIKLGGATGPVAL